MRPFYRSVPLLIATTLLGCDGDISGDTTPVDTDDGVPNIVLPDELLDLGSADNVGELLSAQLVINNTGDGLLEITEIAVEQPFAVALTALTVAAGSSAQVGVFLTPNDYGDTETELLITSNDPDAELSTVLLAGHVIMDVDGDGYDREEAGGDDCDDTDADINPGATEQWYDGYDEDCDGANDYDQDADGYETDVINPNEASGGGDCNDVVAWVHPGAEDLWYDGVDADCAGDSDWDADGDGYGIKLLDKGNDCDDDDDEAYPGSVERLNGKLDDCDGTKDREIPPSSADYMWIGDRTPNGVGYSVAAGDLDGDGIADTVVGAPWYDGYTGGSTPTGNGAVYVWLSGDWIPETGSDVGEAYNNIRGGSSELLGEAVLVLDDFDQLEGSDLAIGAPGAAGSVGTVYVIDAVEVEAYGDTGNAHTQIDGYSSAGYMMGVGFADVEDLDGDGLSELLAAYNSSTSASSGTARLGLFYGDIGSGDGGTLHISLQDAAARWHTNNSTTASKFALSAGGDLNNDGYTDWVYGNPTESPTDGAVFTLWGQAERHSVQDDDISNSTTRGAAGEGSSDGLGYIASILPDMDGDGFDELAWWSSGTATAYVVDGETTAQGVASASDAFLTLTFDEDYTATQIRSLGDWDGDGVDEWILTIDGDSSYSGGLGLVYRGDDFDGEHDGETAALALIYGEPDDGDDSFGAQVMAQPADLDGDGDVDLLTGDAYLAYDLDGDAEGDEAVGAVYTFLNHGL